MKYRIRKLYVGRTESPERQRCHPKISKLLSLLVWSSGAQAPCWVDGGSVTDAQQEPPCSCCNCCWSYWNYNCSCCWWHHTCIWAGILYLLKWMEFSGTFSHFQSPATSLHRTGWHLSLIFESLSCGLRWWKLIIIQLPRVTWNCCFPVSSSLQYKRKQEQWGWVATTTHRTVHAVVFSAFINKLLSIFNFQTAKIAMTSWHN